MKLNNHETTNAVIDPVIDQTRKIDSSRVTAEEFKNSTDAVRINRNVIYNYKN